MTVGKISLVLLIIAVGALAVFSFWPGIFGSGQSIRYDQKQTANVSQVVEEPEKIKHLSTPASVKAIYITSWVAGTESRRSPLIDLIDKTELNSVVIDVKDYTGKLAWLPKDPVLLAAGLGENRISDIEQLIERLHEKNIYVIGRISVFQDLHLAEKRPELAVKRASDGAIWRDRKGLAWLDPTNKEAWDYTIRIAREAYEVGFDELNFDYIRFPSDGNMRDINYAGGAQIVRAVELEKFFKYLDEQLADLGVPLSADLFGLVTVNPDDLGIGQVLERAEPYFDFIAPMVYPSHYADGFIGLANPADHPYEVIKYSLEKARQRLNILSLPPIDLMATSTSTSTPAVPTTITKYSAKLRPWLQDFDLGAVYTPALVRAQMQATYDVGLTSWMLWDPSNWYTREALLVEQK